jgi:dTDP-4-dehydrorhamnose reductase
MMHNSQMNRKILLISVNGQVGHALKSSLQALGEVVVCTRADVSVAVIF